MEGELLPGWQAPPERLTAVVDVGANPIGDAPPYAPMLRAGLCTVVGFEPQPEALSELRARAGPLETYLPHAVGDGAVHTLRIAAASGMTSLLEPDPARLAMFNGFTDWGAVLADEQVLTRRLDDMPELTAMDLLKIDVQGAELIVFDGAGSLLTNAVAVHTEVSFVNLYRDQPSFGDVDRDLRSRGFLPHTLAAIKHWAVAPVIFEGNFRVPGNQLLEGDIVYFRDIGDPDSLDGGQLRQLALVAHHVYGSFDVAHACLQALALRRDCDAQTPRRYLAALASTGRRITAA